MQSQAKTSDLASSYSSASSSASTSHISAVQPLSSESDNLQRHYFESKAKKLRHYRQREVSADPKKIDLKIDLLEDFLYNPYINDEKEIEAWSAFFLKAIPDSPFSELHHALTKRLEEWAASTLLNDSDYLLYKAKLDILARQLEQKKTAFIKQLEALAKVVSDEVYTQYFGLPALNFSDPFMARLVPERESPWVKAQLFKEVIFAALSQDCMASDLAFFYKQFTQGWGAPTKNLNKAKERIHAFRYTKGWESLKTNFLNAPRLLQPLASKLKTYQQDYRTAQTQKARENTVDRARDYLDTYVTTPIQANQSIPKPGFWSRVKTLFQGIKHFFRPIPALNPIYYYLSLWNPKRETTHDLNKVVKPLRAEIVNSFRTGIQMPGEAKLPTALLSKYNLFLLSKAPWVRNEGQAPRRLSFSYRKQLEIIEDTLKGSLPWEAEILQHIHWQKIAEAMDRNELASLLTLAEQYDSLALNMLTLKSGNKKINFADLLKKNTNYQTVYDCKLQIKFNLLVLKHCQLTKNQQLEILHAFPHGTEILSQLKWEQIIADLTYTDVLQLLRDAAVSDALKTKLREPQFSQKCLELLQKNYPDQNQREASAKLNSRLTQLKHLANWQLLEFIGIAEHDLKKLTRHNLNNVISLLKNSDDLTAFLQTIKEAPELVSKLKLINKENYSFKSTFQHILHSDVTTLDNYKAKLALLADKALLVKLGMEEEMIVACKEALFKRIIKLHQTPPAINPVPWSHSSVLKKQPDLLRSLAQTLTKQPVVEQPVTEAEFYRHMQGMRVKLGEKLITIPHINNELMRADFIEYLFKHYGIDEDLWLLFKKNYNYLLGNIILPYAERLKSNNLYAESAKSTLCIELQANKIHLHINYTIDYFHPIECRSSQVVFIPADRVIEAPCQLSATLELTGTDRLQYNILDYHLDYEIENQPGLSSSASASLLNEDEESALITEYKA